MLLEYATCFREVVDDAVKKWNQQKNACRREMIQDDLRKGGPKAFKGLKSEGDMFISHFVETKSFVVKPQRWNKGGNAVILVQGPLDDMNPQYPIEFHGQSGFVQRIVGDRVWLRTPLVCKSGFDMVITQKSCIGDPVQLEAKAREDWQKLWSRDLENVDEQDWDDAVQFVTALDDCPSCDYRPITEVLWKEMLRGVSNKSARGACAFTPTELRILPWTLIRFLIRIYEYVEATGHWPRMLTWARVVLLRKGDEPPTDALATRPITILSRLYRQWSRIRSIQVLQHIGKLIPPEVSGVAGGTSSDALAAFVSCIIENSLLEEDPRCGLVVDILKCFNQIPRVPLMCLFTKLNLPEEYVRAFWGLLHQMGRMIEVGGNLGEPCYSTTGVAEGDAMSVASMAALTLVAIHAIQAENPNITPACFADNWSIIASSVGDLCKSTEVLQKVVDKFRMNLSVPKSWVWGTTKLMRKELSTFEIDGKPVPLKHTAKDLGVDMSYGRRLNKKTTKARWCKALGVLRKVRSRYLPVKFKILMTSSVGVGTISYGSEFTGHSKWEWRSIRAGIATAINRLGSGANGLLAMAVTGDVVDPQLRIYVRMVKFWRRCLRIFPSMRTKFLANLCTGTCTNRTGPAGVFRVAFRMIGWECKDNGVLEHQSGLRLEWMQCSIRFLKKMLTLAWSNYVCTEMSKREAFDVQFFDAEMFRRSLQGRSHADQGLLTTYASGRHVTHDVLSKFSYKVHDSCCPLCKDHQDSKEHRIYQCLALREFRDSKVWRWLRNQPRAVSHFGICPLQIDAILEKQRVQSSVESFVLPVIEDQRAIVFTDGSAFHNDNFQLCVGGCAVVEWKGKPRLLVRALLATVDHSSFRAESYAIYLAMQRKRLVDIYCDCAAVVGLLQYLLECRGSNVTPDLSEHTDLWSPIWRHVQVRGHGEIRIFMSTAVPPVYLL